MGSCASCCRTANEEKPTPVFYEDPTQSDNEKISIEKIQTAEERAEQDTAEKPAAVVEAAILKERTAESVEKRRKSKEKSVESDERKKKSKERSFEGFLRRRKSKERSVEFNERRRKSKEAEKRQQSLERTARSDERMSKQAVEPRKGFSQVKKKKEGTGVPDKRKQEKNDDSGSEVIDYWLTPAEQKKAATKESKELPVDKTSEFVLSVVQPPSVDYSKLPPSLQVSKRKQEQPSAKPPSNVPIWTTNIPSERQPEAYGVADRPPEMASGLNKPMAPQAYGVTDRPPHIASGSSGPTAPQAYGVADRPPHIASGSSGPTTPQAYGVADRPMPQNYPKEMGFKKMPIKQDSSYGVADRPYAPVPPVQKTYGTNGHQAVMGSGSTSLHRQRPSYNHEPGMTNGRPDGMSPAHSYKLYGGGGFVAKTNERSDYRF